VIATFDLVSTMPLSVLLLFDEPLPDLLPILGLIEKLFPLFLKLSLSDIYRLLNLCIRSEPGKGFILIFISRSLISEVIHLI